MSHNSTRIIKTCFALLFFLIFNCSAFEKPILHCVADEWKGYTNADGSGTYWQIIRSIYADKYQLKLQTTPFHRAIKLVTTGKADCIVAIYTKDKRNLLVPKYHLDTEYPANLLFDKTRHNIKSKDDLDNLDNLVIVGLKDYGLEHFLPNPLNLYGVDSHKKMNELIMNSRVDAAIVYTHNIRLVDPTGKLNQIEIIPDKKYYLGFYPSELGSELVKQYDSKLPKLILDGTIKNSFADDLDYQHANFVIIE